MRKNKVIYYYCQHFKIDQEDEEKLLKIIRTKNFEDFMIIAKKYGRFYFPEYALVRDKYNHVIGKINVYYLEGFKMIDEFKNED